MINLLPENYKRELAQARRQEAMTAAGIILALFLLSFVLGLSALYFYLQGEYVFEKALAENLSLELSNPEKTELKNQVAAFNQAVAFVDSSIQSRESLSPALKTLSGLLNEDFEVDTVSYDKSSGAISILGKVERREKLLELKSVLEKEPLFSQVDFPPSNWVKSRDISFFIILKQK